ncbi:permease-like protein [Stylonychia lemnae]|uniref:Permease-like protein n=1 Tax=Stylonychia lemnae TaxID=5949 RepID=A0A078AQ80_STYLE|nr:permease-like protein [Stylonychia lemnae]|eukprot:CDW83103.1 permease-like protein [Stylonychia lemnae]
MNLSATSAVRRNSLFSNPQGSSHDGSIPSQDDNDQNSYDSIHQQKDRIRDQEPNDQNSLSNSRLVVAEDNIGSDLLVNYKESMPEHLKENYYYQKQKSYEQYNPDIDQRTLRVLKSGGFCSQLMTNLTYLLNDMRKRDRQFQIGLISVFMVVAFTTLLTAFVNSTPSLFFMVAQSNSGDFDITLTALAQDSQYESGNTNFYLDSAKMFEKSGVSDQYSDSQPRQYTVASMIGGQQLPLLNLTAINREIKDISEIDGAYPRWIALAQVACPKSPELGDTGSFIAYGDQKLERDLGVSNGFPTNLMGKDDAIVSRDLLDIFGIEVGDQILIKYEFLSFLPARYDIFSTIIFDQIPEDLNKQNLTRGQLFLQTLNLKPDIKFSEFRAYVNRTQGPQTYILVTNTALLLGYNDNTPISVILEDFFRQVQREDFILQKNYTVIAEVTNTFGKWPRAFGNAVFMDSNYLFENFIEMLYKNTVRLSERNGYSMNMLIRTEDIFAYLKDFLQNQTISEYAMTVNMQIKDRMMKYNQDGGTEIMDSIILAYQKQTLFETSSGILSIQEKTKNISMMKAMLTALFINIIFFIFVLAFILNQSLVQSDVEERTYEFAMLRTLGYQKRQLVQLLSFQTLFFSVPGSIIGFIVMILALIPLISNFLPVRQAMAKSLRDSLDVYRKSIDDITVTMTKIENMGISPMQMLIGITLTIFGFVVYYFIPQSIMNMNYDLFFLLILSVLFTMVIGMSLISQSFVSPIERFVIALIIFCKPGDRKLKAILYKNLRSHKIRNMKTSLMFTMTICFLMYSSTSFAELEYMMFSLTGAIIGADIALFRSTSIGGQTVNEILVSPEGSDLKIKLGVKGQQNFKVKVYGMPRDHLEIQTTEYFYPTQVWDGYSVMNKTYQSNEAMHLMYDLGNYSIVNQYEDSLQIRSNIDSSQREQFKVDDTIINVIIPEAFVGILPIKAGEEMELCMNDDCKLSFRARVVATIRRIPGLFDVSGYTPTVYMSPGVVISYDQMNVMINEYISRNPEAKTQYESYMASQPTQTSYNIPKKSVYVKIREDAETKDINKIKNSMVKIAGETNVFAFDVRQFNKSLKEYMVIMYLMSNIIATILFILTFFQLIVSISSNIRDDEWELGVLRAIGLQKSDIVKLTLYESIANMFTSSVLGFIIGIISATAMAALFLAIVELPLNLILSFQSIILMLFMTMFTIIVGTYLGTKQINSKSITSVLKGV